MLVIQDMCFKLLDLLLVLQLIMLDSKCEAVNFLLQPSDLFPIKLFSFNSFNRPYLIITILLRVVLITLKVFCGGLWFIYTKIWCRVFRFLPKRIVFLSCNLWTAYGCMVNLLCRILVYLVTLKLRVIISRKSCWLNTVIMLIVSKFEKLTWLVLGRHRL